MAAPWREQARLFRSIQVAGLLHSTAHFRTSTSCSVTRRLLLADNSRNCRLLYAALIGGFALFGVRKSLIVLANQKADRSDPAPAVVLVPSIGDSKQTPWHKIHGPTKKVTYAGDKSGLKLTLYQYTSCPFCCKTRAYLDYYGISYDIVEVNSITKKEKKWTSYERVPLLVSDHGTDYTEVRDSSVIISVLHSWQEARTKQMLETLLSYYPCLESKEGRRTAYEFTNKYFLMHGDEQPRRSLAELREEREWRQWVDDNLVHTLSPNIYRTLSEAVQSFRYFSGVGEWEKSMSVWSRLTCVYLGSLIMWTIAGRLKRRHGLDDDVRQSLYRSVRQWLEGIGPSRKFMGGSRPNLADLAVYGVLSSIEGCQAFEDLVANTKVMTWYEPMKKAVTGSEGQPVS